MSTTRRSLRGLIWVEGHEHGAKAAFAGLLQRSDVLIVAIASDELVNELAHGGPPFEGRSV